MYNIRTVTPEDAEELLSIYAYYVENTAITFEYNVPSVSEFRERIEETLKIYPYLAAVDENGRIAGYVYAGRFHAREAYDWCVETSIYVRQDLRRVGLGRLLHDALEEALQKQHIINMNACIAWPMGEDPYLTEDSVHFHEHMGYRMVGEFRRCGYKFNRWYNMVYMEKLIGDAEDPMPPMIPFEELNR